MILSRSLLLLVTVGVVLVVVFIAGFHVGFNHAIEKMKKIRFK